MEMDLTEIISILKKECNKKEMEFVSIYIRYYNYPNIAQPQLVIILCSWFYFQLLHETWHPTIDSFEQMNLKKNLLRGLYQNDIRKPTQVQRRALLPLITKGSDVDISVESFKGSGKTVAWSIAALQRIDPQISQCQILTLIDGDVRARKCEELVKKLGCFMDMSCKAIVNGDLNDINGLRQGIQIVIGRPAKIYIMIMQKVLSLKHLKLCVLDDADSMNLAKAKDCIYCLPLVQMAVFSTTSIKKYLCMPKKIKIKIKRACLTLDGIKQFYVCVEKEQYKLETLCDLFEELSFTQCVVYCYTKQKVMWLLNKCDTHNFKVCAVHIGMNKKEIKQNLKRFKNMESNVLITEDLNESSKYYSSLIINYDLPMTAETYLCRNGRSGHFGRKDVVINLVSNEDIPKLNFFISYFETNIEELPMNINDIL